VTYYFPAAQQLYLYFAHKQKMGEASPPGVGNKLFPEKKRWNNVEVPQSANPAKLIASFAAILAVVLVWRSLIMPLTPEFTHFH